LVLLSDRLADFGLLRIKLCLSGNYRGDCGGQVRASLLQLRRHLGVFRLGRREFLARPFEPCACHIKFVLCLVDRDDRRTQGLAGLIEVAFGLGDLLLDPGALRYEFVSGSWGRKQGRGERRRYGDCCNCPQRMCSGGK
jgi:hypothetical protein